MALFMSTSFSCRELLNSLYDVVKCNNFLHYFDDHIFASFNVNLVQNYKGHSFLKRRQVHQSSLRITN